MRYLILFTLLASTTWAWGQTLPDAKPLTEDVLLFEKVGTKRAVWFRPGDTIRYQLKGEEEWTVQILEKFTDEGALRFTIDTVELKQIAALDIYDRDAARRRNRNFGTTIAIAGLAYALVDQFNIVWQHGRFDISPKVLATSGLISAGGGLWALAGRPTQKVKGRWRLRITPLPLRLVQ